MSILGWSKLCIVGILLMPWSLWKGIKLTASFLKSEFNCPVNLKQTSNSWHRGQILYGRFRGVNTVLIWNEFPELCSGLVTTLSSLNLNDFSHYFILINFCNWKISQDPVQIFIIRSIKNRTKKLSYKYSLFLILLFLLSPKKM